MSETHAIVAQAELHHQYFLGLQLMVAVEEPRAAVYDWMFRLFRRQHEEKFLSSFGKLGLEGLPHAIACAKYHVLSNGVGGVAVEYMEESDRKAWVRFRYPRWMFAGAAICGIPKESGRGFLHGWYAQNGVSLNNPRLGFVCVSEDVTGQFGLCGYFQEYGYDLRPEQRLQFAPTAAVPRFDRTQQPSPPGSEWHESRLIKANRNYAVDFIRNGMRALIEVLGRSRAQELAQRSARLTGLQHYPRMAQQVGAVDGGVGDAAKFLIDIMAGMGDRCSLEAGPDGSVLLTQTGLNVVRNIQGADRHSVLIAWIELWRGAVHSHREFMDVQCEIAADSLRWKIQPSTAVAMT